MLTDDKWSAYYYYDSSAFAYYIGKQDTEINGNSSYFFLVYKTVTVI